MSALPTKADMRRAIQKCPLSARSGSGSAEELVERLAMTITQFTPLTATIGGVLIGIAAVTLMAFNGRIAGISGILGRLFPPFTETAHLTRRASCSA